MKVKKNICMIYINLYYNFTLNILLFFQVFAFLLEMQNFC